MSRSSKKDYMQHGIQTLHIGSGRSDLFLQKIFVQSTCLILLSFVSLKRILSVSNIECSLGFKFS